jgi:hypothetical protein
MATMLEDILTFIGYMLPACLVVSVVVGLSAWMFRLARRSTNQASEFVQVMRDIRQLMEQSVALQNETNRLLAQQAALQQKSYYSVAMLSMHCHPLAPPARAGGSA